MVEFIRTRVDCNGLVHLHVDVVAGAGENHELVLLELIRQNALASLGQIVLPLKRSLNALAAVEKDADEVATSDILVGSKKNVAAARIGVHLRPDSTGLDLIESRAMVHGVASLAIGDPDGIENIAAVRLLKFAGDLHRDDDSLVKRSSAEHQTVRNIVG